MKNPFSLIARLLLLCTLLQASSSAQSTAPSSSSEVPPPLPPGINDLHVYLVTLGPGPEVYEVFGHNAILMENMSTGTQILYNWGVFDFDQPNFIGRFIQGRMIYSMRGEFDPRRSIIDHAIAACREEGRSVTRRELNLSPAQRYTLLKFCVENDTDEKREYRYDYYRDNCSTRVRDAIDAATGGQVRAVFLNAPAGPRDGLPVTFRYHTDRCAQAIPWLYVGLKYVMGHPIDQPLDLWGNAFLPAELETSLAKLSINWEDGSSHPLLGPATVLLPASRTLDLSRPPRWEPYFLLAGLLLGGSIYLLSRPPSLLARAGSLLLALAWVCLCLVGGTINTFGWLFTDHVVARNNENWLQLNPLSLPLFVGAAYLLLRPRKRPKWLLYAAAIPLALSITGWIFKLLPMMIQPNWAILLLALPAHTGIYLAFRNLLRKPTA